MNFNVLSYDTLESTNMEALRQAKMGASEGLCIRAREQTAGRGRHGRNWVSGKDSGLYFSIVLRPILGPKNISLITFMTGIAVHDTLSELGLQPDIKWVNDVLVDDKKICGILAETTDTRDGQAVVVGIGINLRSTNFPSEIAGTATSIEEALSKPIAVDDVVGSLTKNFEHFYDVLKSSGGPTAILNEWRKRSTYFSGKPVRVFLGKETVTGVTDGLESTGALRLKRDDGSVTIIHAGDVERLRAAI